MAKYIQATLKFIDKRDQVLERMDAKQKRVLFQTAGYARTTVARSMRKARKGKRDKKGRLLRRPDGSPVDSGGSAPGEPPRTRSGEIRKLMAFEVSGRNEYVVGPRIFKPSRKNPARMVGAKTVPELLEKGGSRVTKYKGKQVRMGYEPRPFIQPATKIAADFMAKKMEALNF